MQHAQLLKLVCCEVCTHTLTHTHTRHTPCECGVCTCTEHSRGARVFLAIRSYPPPSRAAGVSLIFVFSVRERRRPPRARGAAAARAGRGAAHRPLSGPPAGGVCAGARGVAKSGGAGRVHSDDYLYYTVHGYRERDVNNIPCTIDF